MLEIRCRKYPNEGFVGNMLDFCFNKKTLHVNVRGGFGVLGVASAYSRLVFVNLSTLSLRWITNGEEL